MKEKKYSAPTQLPLVWKITVCCTPWELVSGHILPQTAPGFCWQSQCAVLSVALCRHFLWAVRVKTPFIHPTALLLIQSVHVWTRTLETFASLLPVHHFPIIFLMNLWKSLRYESTFISTTPLLTVEQHAISKSGSSIWQFRNLPNVHVVHSAQFSL